MKYIFTCGKHTYDFDMPVGEDWTVLCPICGAWGKKDFRLNALTQTLQGEFHQQWHYDESGKEVPDSFIPRSESRNSEIKEWREGRLKGKLVNGPHVTYVEPELG